MQIFFRFFQQMGVNKREKGVKKGLRRVEKGPKKGVQKKRKESICSPLLREGGVRGGSDKQGSTYLNI